MSDKEIYEKFMLWMGMKATKTKIIEKNTVVRFEDIGKIDNRFTKFGYDEFFAGAVFDENGKIVCAYIDSHVSSASDNSDKIDELLKDRDTNSNKIENIDHKLIEMMEAFNILPEFNKSTNGFTIGRIEIMDGIAYRNNLETEIGTVNIQNLEEQSEIFAEFNGCNGYEVWNGMDSSWHTPKQEDKLIQY